MKAVIDGLIWLCTPLEAVVRAQTGLCIIACQDLDGKLEAIDVLRFDEDGPQSDARLSEPASLEVWGKRCRPGRLWACFYPMPGPRHTDREREGLESTLRSQHAGRLCRGC